MHRLLTQGGPSPAVMAAALVLLAPAGALRAQTSTWTGAGNGAAWADPDNWDPPFAPDGSGAEVFILLPDTVHIAGFLWDQGGPDVGTLAIGPDAALVLEGLNNYSLMEIWGDVDNDGEILLDSRTYGTWIQFRGATTFSGAGSLSLDDDPNPNVLTFLRGFPIVNGATHTIRGAGDVWLPVTNLGTIDAHLAERSLRLSDQDKINSGTMRATAGGRLLIGGIEVDNATGVIAASGADSRVQLTAATIRGGQLIASDGGFFEMTWTKYGSGAVLDTVSVQGDLHVTTSSGLAIMGPTFTQDGTTWNDGLAIRFDDPATTLAGPGTIVLRGPNAALGYDDESNVVTVGDEFTVRGRGPVSVSVDNRGLIEADVPGETLVMSWTSKTSSGRMRAVGGSTLHVWGVDVANSGVIEARGAGSTIRVDTGGSVTQTDEGSIRAADGAVILATGSITGGSIDTADGGLLSASGSLTLDGVTHAGRAESSSLLIVRSTITNDGTVAMLDPGGGNTSSMAREGDVSFAGTGRVSLDAGPWLLSAQVGPHPSTPEAVLTNEAEHAITGRGLLSGSYVNRGLISPDDPGVSEIGEFLMEDGWTITCEATSEIRFHVGGDEPGAFDRITGQGSGTLVCAGALVVEHLPGFDGLEFGAFVDLITLPAARRFEGRFDDVDLPDLQGVGQYRVQYLADRVRLIVLNPADINADGTVDFGDLLLLLAAWGPCPDPPADCLADLDDSGIVDFGDLLVLLSNWG